MMLSRCFWSCWVKISFFTEVWAFFLLSNKTSAKANRLFLGFEDSTLIFSLLWTLWCYWNRAFLWVWVVFYYGFDPNKSCLALAFGLLFFYVIVYLGVCRTHPVNFEACGLLKDGKTCLLGLYFGIFAAITPAFRLGITISTAEFSVFWPRALTG